MQPQTRACIFARWSVHEMFSLLLLCLTDNRLYSATSTDKQARDALIFDSPVGGGGGGEASSSAAATTSMTTLRTQQYDSAWLNKPNHVKLFEYGDKVYFLFSEIAVEYINCGKVRVSACATDVILAIVWSAI